MKVDHAEAGRTRSLPQGQALRLREV